MPVKIRCLRDLVGHRRRAPSLELSTCPIPGPDDCFFWELLYVDRKRSCGEHRCARCRPHALYNAVIKNDTQNMENGCKNALKNTSKNTSYLRIRLDGFFAHEMRKIVKRNALAKRQLSTKGNLDPILDAQVQSITDEKFELFFNSILRKKEFVNVGLNSKECFDPNLPK